MESLFSCIRRFGGFNNNPTVVQLRSAYKKLLSHVSISVPLTANCISGEDTLLITVNNQNEQQTNESIIQISDGVLLVIGHAIDFVELNNYLIDIIAYMSGAVVRMVMKKIKCETCNQYLLIPKDRKPTSCLQRRKTRGNLISASEDVICICKIR